MQKALTEAQEIQGNLSQVGSSSIATGVGLNDDSRNAHKANN